MLIEIRHGNHCCGEMRSDRRGLPVEETRLTSRKQRQKSLANAGHGEQQAEEEGEDDTEAEESP